MIDIPALRASCGGPSMQQLRRLHSGELNDLEAYKLRLHTGSCVACQETLSEFDSDREALNRLLPLAVLEKRILESESPWRFGRRFGAGMLIPLAAAAAFFLAPTITPTDSALDQPSIRPKGGAAAAPSLDFFVQSANGARSGKDGESLNKGDQIRLRYESGNHAFVLIVGVDADGQVFPYLTDRDRSVRAPSGQTLAPNSIVLDADPRPERVFAIYSAEPIAVDEVKPVAKDAVRSVGGHVEKLLELPIASAAQRSLLLNKAAK